MKAKRSLWKHIKMVSSLTTGGQRNLRTRTNNYQSCWVSKVKFPTRQFCYAKTRALRGKNKTLTYVLETSGLWAPKSPISNIPLNPLSLQYGPSLLTKRRHSSQTCLKTIQRLLPCKTMDVPLRICHHLLCWLKGYERIF